MTYTPATVEDLKRRYPAFDAVPDATVREWLEVAATDCAGFPVSTRSRAELALAAHFLNENGMGAGAVPAGITSFKSGTFAATMTDAAASRTGFDASIYGREFVRLRRTAFAGPRMAWTPPVNA